MRSSAAPPSGMVVFLGLDVPLEAKKCLSTLPTLDRVERWER